MTVKNNVEMFWKHFQSEENTIIQSLKDKSYKQLQESIEKMDDEAMKKFGAHFFVEDSSEYLELVFDPGPNKTSQYLTRYCVEQAPQAIRSKWILNDVLPPMSQKAIKAQVKIKDQEYYLNDFFVFYTVDTKNKMIACDVYNPSYSLIDNTERKKEMSMYLVELAIGENAYEAYLSKVDFIDQPDDQRDFCNLIEFYEKIDEIVKKEKWPTYEHPTDIYSVYRPIKEIADDSLRKDMKYIFTTHPLLIEESISQQHDVVSDLKAKDGEFGYIYYLNPFHSKEDAILRQNLSKQLDEQMTKIGAAKVIGGAIGKSYAYIDLIIYDTKSFKKALQNLQGQLSKNLAFHYQPF